MILNDIIVHKLEKAANEQSTLTLADTALTVTERETQFINSIKDAYYKKSNPNYGVFDANSTSFPYQNFLNNFIQGNTDFHNFTIQSMNHLQAIIDTVPQATGGYVIFAHYTVTDELEHGGQNHSFMMTVMLNDKKVYNINNQLALYELFGLDIEKLDVANLVNFNKWNNNEETYLSFARGRKDISIYFRNFIGCTDQMSAKQSSTLLKIALLDYLNTLDITDSEKEEIRNQVYDYCITQTSNKEDISLNHISSIINTDEPYLFTEFASGENYRVSSIIKGHKDSLKNLKFFIYKSKKLRLEFDSELMNESIFYNKDTNEIRITDVPDGLKSQFLNEL